MTITSLPGGSRDNDIINPGVAVTMTLLTRGYSRDNDTVNPVDVFVKPKLEDNRG